MLRHHSFAKSLVQEKERDLKEEGRTDAYNYHILQSDFRHMSGLINNEFKIGKIGGI